MACRGVFFALTPSQRDRLLELSSDRDRIDYIQEDIEEAWDEAHVFETDKAWDAIHRCLTDGTLTIGSASSPLGKLILGGTQLYSDTNEYIVNLIEHGEFDTIYHEHLCYFSATSVDALFRRPEPQIKV